MAQLNNICKKIFLNPVVHRKGHLHQIKLLSTTGKKDDIDKACNPQGAMYKKVPDFSKPVINNENWISFGFDENDRANDKFKLHVFFFTFISLFFCGGGFLVMYFPDRGRKDWARREAFIRLHEREQLGLTPIDPNYIDPSKMTLPPDEQLSDEDIVI